MKRKVNMLSIIRRERRQIISSSIDKFPFTIPARIC